MYSDTLHLVKCDSYFAKGPEQKGIFEAYMEEYKWKKLTVQSVKLVATICPDSWT